MHRFLINFRQTAKARAAQVSYRAFQHYRLRLKTLFDRIQAVKNKVRNYNFRFKQPFRQTS